MMFCCLKARDNLLRSKGFDMSAVENVKKTKIDLSPKHYFMIAFVMILFAALLFFRTTTDHKVAIKTTKNQNQRSPSFEYKVDQFKKSSDFYGEGRKPSNAHDSNDKKSIDDVLSDLFSKDDKNINQLISEIGKNSNPVNGSTSKSFSYEDFMVEQQMRVYQSIAEADFDVIDHTQSLSQSLSLNETKQMRLSKGGHINDGESVLSMGSVVHIVSRSESSNHYLGSPFFGMVTQDVYDYQRQNILINKGASVIGKVDNLITTNPTVDVKMGIIVEKIKRSDGSVIAFDMPASDSDGLGGIPGDVKHHSLRKWGGFAAFALLSSGLSINAGDNETPQSSSDLAYDRMKSQFGSSASAAANEFLSIKPTVTLHTGESISVMVHDDIYVSPLGAIQ